MNKKRLISLDVFRGFTVLLMTIVNNPGSWEHIYDPLEHSKWNGCTPTDLVFPFFIFIMGTAIPFAMRSKHWDATIFNKIVVRSLRIFCLGLFLNCFEKIELFGLEGISLLIFRLLITGIVGFALLGNFNRKIKTFLAFAVLISLLSLAYSSIVSYQSLRIPGVLQRIGIVYFFTSILFLKTNLKTQISIAASLLLVYWFLMSCIPVPGFGEPNFDKGTNLAAWLDNYILNGHLWRFSVTWDPQGILSTLPAIATGILGMIIGQVLNLEIQKLEIIKRLCLMGILFVILGLFWNTVFPINKSLWTSSYVLYTAGLATLILTILYFVIEIAKYKRWSKIMVIWGVNPMIVFFLSGVLPRSWNMIKVQNGENAANRVNVKEYFYSHTIMPLFSDPLNASLAFAVLNAVFWTFILWILYKKSLIFKV